MTRIDSRPSNANESLRADIARQQTQGASPGVKDAKKTGVVEGLASVGLPHVASPVGADTSLSLAGANGEPNPFVSLLQAGALIPPRELAASLGLAKDPSPNEEALFNLGALEAKVADLGEGKCEAALGRLGNVRKGLMLVLSDAANAHLKASGGGSRETMQSVASAIHEDVKLELKTFAATQAALLKSNAQFPLGMDVNAFVQAVLRESYMLQCEMMRDYAEKVKYYNELKKQIRAQKAEAMKLRSSLEEGDPIPEEFFIYFDAEKGEMVQYDATIPTSMADEIVAAANGQPGATPSTGSRSGQIDPQQSSGTSPSGLQGTWSNELGQHFEYVATESPTLDGFVARLSTSTQKWHERYVDVFKNYGDGDGNTDDKTEILNLMSKELGSVAPEAFAELFQCVFQQWHWAKDNEKDLAKDNAKEIMLRMVSLASADQLAHLKQKYPGEWVWAVGQRSSIAGVVSAYEATRAALPYALRSAGPPLQEIVDIYASLVSGSGNGKTLARLQEKLRNVSPEEARLFLSACAETGSPLYFDQLFAALDGERTFRAANPEDWTFLRNMGGAAAEFFAAWTGQERNGAPASPALGSLLGQKPNVALKVATPSMALGTPVMAPARIMGQAGTSSAGFTNETEASTDASPPDEAETDETTKLVPFNADVMDNFIKALEENLNSVGDDAQLANNDLQNALQQQQQVLQMMSNISKMLHDTAMSIIRKIGG